MAVVIIKRECRVHAAYNYACTRTIPQVFTLHRI